LFQATDISQVTLFHVVIHNILTADSVGYTQHVVLDHYADYIL